MKTIAVSSVKLSLPFKAGELPAVPWQDPRFELVLGGVKIQVQISAKCARKLGVWQGSAVLQGRLVLQDGRLVLLDAGFAFADPRPVEVVEAVPVAAVGNGSCDSASPLAGRVAGRPGRREEG